ncbi:MAG: LLM class F420-dependent oxidoreductase [Chloroflexota bacterium]
MKIGLQIPYFNWEGGPASYADRLTQICQKVEEVGFSSLWVMDHLFQMEVAGDAADPMLEAYTTLGYLAAQTRTVRLGSLVTGVIYRYPGMLAKIVTTLDVLSGGRAYLGIGAAWYEREAVGLGIPFPPLKARFEQLEETLRIIRQMWSDHNGPFVGEHYRLQETINEPQPLSQPYPPIMVGGMGEKKTLRLVAQYADASNFDTGIGLDGLKHKLNVLREHCDRLGRDYDTIEKTVIHHVPSLEAIADLPDLCRSWAGIGITHAIFNTPAIETLSPLDQFAAQVIPVAHGL